MTALRNACYVLRHVFARSIRESALNDLKGLIEFLAGEFQAWWTNPRVSHADLRLNQLDELNKFNYGIHSQEWQEPAIKLEGLIPFAVLTKLE